MKNLDFFRKVNQDIETQTSSGAIFSLFAAICGIVLFMNEYKEFKRTDTVSSLFVENDFDHDFKVNLNITFTQAPCSVISIVAEDELGQKIDQDLHKNLTFTRIDVEGVEIPNIEYSSNYKNSDQEAKDLIKAIQENEQCQVTGDFLLKKTPGSFIFNFSKYGTLVSRINRMDIAAYKKLDIDFIINTLYFGELVESHKDNILGFSWFGKRQFNILTLYDIEDKAIDPYKGLEFKHEGAKVQYENHLSILPVELGKIGKYALDQEVYQYNIYSGTIAKRLEDLPSAYFRYKFNPVNIKYEQQKKSGYHFVVQMLAIIGGIFSLVGIVYSSVQSALDKYKQIKSN